jgi:glycosyltransferase involved in cell wall biosynthesis
VSSPSGRVHLVVPAGIDDPGRPSGGNTYDRRIRSALADDGWSVAEHAVRGAWPWAGDAGGLALGEALRAVPDGSRVLVDGLVASAYPEVLVPAARRLRLVVLMHMPVGLGPVDDRARGRECAVVAAAAAVVTTSEWCRRWLLEAYAVDPARVHVARPGVDRAPPVAGSPGGGRLLCVGSVTAAKGQHHLVAALAGLSDLDWRCTLVGPLTVAPDDVRELGEQVRQAGLRERVELVGALTGTQLDAAYAAADLLVHPSHAETYGMVVTEALARGLPVVAVDVGGVPEALGVTDDGRVPGLLTGAGDVAGLAEALRRWLCDSSLRSELRGAARRRRATLTGWSETARRVAQVLEGVA